MKIAVPSGHGAEEESASAHLEPHLREDYRRDRAHGRAERVAFPRRPLRRKRFAANFRSTKDEEKDGEQFAVPRY